ncbi:odorant receptor 33a-like [Diachasma alloeum]|uniref:Odorant receptor n=1 Tax=Diachasma alloeum TaxID=454923 RepID=A0A4E0S0U2_9HYME|nr:odorant receptor 33a-like [Diachasma alloeum]THK32870.1 odorant receptor 106 [Diachasma alloeum]
MSKFFHKETFPLLKYMGFWKPQELSKWKSILYDIYSTIIVTLIMSSGLAQFLGICFLSHTNLRVFMQNIFIGLTTMSICLKVVNWFYSLSKIINILEMLKQHPFECQTREEYLIYHRLSSKNRRISITSLTYCMMSVAYYFIDQIVTIRPQRTLPLSAWLPYDYSNSSKWWFSSSYLALVQYLMAVFNEVYNVFFFELMMQSVAQVKILKNRLHVMMTTLVKAHSTKNHLTKNDLLMERELYHKCVQYHIAILRLTRDINSIFAPIMMVQYLITSITLPSTVYLISKTMICSRDFLKLGAYAAFLLQQMLILCYAGHRTYLEFDSIGDVLYTSDWIALRESSKQSMKLMLVSAQKPFVFDCFGMLKLDMEAFKNALMLAYSIYNIF